MHKFHELVERLWGKFIGGRPATREGYDAIIRSFLEEKAKELARRYNLVPDTQRWYLSVVSEILGLSEEKETVYICKEHMIENCTKSHKPKQEPEHVCKDAMCPCKLQNVYRPTKPKTAEEWMCDHNGVMDGPFYKFRCDSDYKFCPICGTPRPKVKSLAEKLQDRMDDHAYCGADLAKIATDHFNSTKEK